MLVLGVFILVQGALMLVHGVLMHSNMRVEQVVGVL